MSVISHELEQALARELEQEGLPEAAHEAAHEQEEEHEAFFNHLAAMADRRGRSHALRRVALAAARAALRTQPPPPPGIEGELEFEDETLAEAELEVAAHASTPAQLDAVLEHLGHTAAEAQNEQEAAEHFLPLIPLAAKALLPIAAKTLGPAVAKLAPKIIGRVAPTLTRAVANTTRALFRSPTARPLLHAMPKIARGTIGQLAQRIARGQRVDPRIALRTLAQNTYRTLSQPAALANAYRRSLRADRLHHARAGRLVGSTPRRYLQRPANGNGHAVTAAPSTPGFSMPQPVPMPAYPPYWYPAPAR